MAIIAAKARDVSGGCFEFGAASQDVLEFLLVVVVHAVGVAGDPAGHLQAAEAVEALVPALVQVGLVWVQGAGEVLPAACGQFLPGDGAGIAPDGVPGQFEAAGDGPDAEALTEEFVHGGVVLPGPLGQPARVGDWRVQDFRACLRGGGRRAKAGTVLADQYFHDLGEVVPEMPQIWRPHLERQAGSRL
ncbi:hypothetical protein AB0I77_47200 [Streptomyces sp. NPDC050619]|uniref:hypothetical protein n=1 Tax=Streptomyces sp. NPDC050619 TaxID=3157214 RepID=UPI00341C540C